MSRLGRTLSLPRAVAGAVRRNGVRNVWRFTQGLVERHGLTGTIAYAMTPKAARRERLARMETDAEVRAREPERSGDFDADWTVSAERWREHLAAAAVRRAAIPAPTLAGPRPTVHVVTAVAQAAAQPPADAADADWVVVLAPGDAPEAELAPRIADVGADPALQVISFDMTYAGADDRVAPVLLPGATPWLARWADVGFGRYAVRAELLRAGRGQGGVHGQVRGWLAGRPLNDARDRWAHVAEPLVRAALTPADITAARDRGVAQARSALRPDRDAPERVSVVICTHDRGRLVRQLVRALDDPRIAEVVVVANSTTSAPALETLEWVRARSRCRVLVRDEPFNFSKLSNAGAALTTGDRLLFLNDDITPVSDDWLEPLLQPLRDADVGVTGPLLLYPDETVQHAGVYLGYRTAAGHLMRGARLPEEDYLFYGALPREMTAVTGAVMMVRRDLFEALNGFDELLPTFLQDVDLCLRARAVGLTTVWTPLAELIHMESTSIKVLISPDFHRQRHRERARFVERWRDLVGDPMRNPALDIDDETQRRLAKA